MTAFVASSRRVRLPVWLRLALRELRGGLAGFRVFLACLALGVAAIAGVGSVARALSDGLAREGGTILGGDVAFSLIHREANPEERVFLESRGRVAAVATMRVMARTPDGNATLAELKAVDAAYPLLGQVETEPPLALPDAFAERDGAFGTVADPALLARLGLDVGDRIAIGGATLEVRARLVSEPDALSGGIGFGPRLLASDAALRASGLVQPGSLVRWSYRLTLSEDEPDDAVRTLVEDARRAFPQAGWEARTRDNASVQLARNLERFSQFLTIVGLTALVVGGVGVANGVNAYVDRKREVIATLKCMGATGGRIFAIYLAQVMAIALVGIAIGLVLGAAIPFVLAWGFGHLLPLPIAPSLQEGELLLAAAYGLLVALAFALWPLGRAHDVPVSALFRDHVTDGSSWPRPRYLALVLLAVAALAALALVSAYDKWVATVFIGAVAAVFVLLRLVALGLMALARRLPRPRWTELRLALANMHRPGALTPSVVLSLGLGLALLVALTLIDASIRRQLASDLPERAPSFFFMEIPRAESDAFTGFLRARAPSATVELVPMLRGRITRLKDIPAADYPAPSEAAWVLNGDRGITHSERVPDGSRLVAGAWWAPDQSGENLVSFAADLAEELGLAVGDRLAVNVLGREVEARIANLRTVDWENLGINFVMVFSPNTFRGAPYQSLATLAYPDGGSPAQELALLRDVAGAFPSVLAVRVKDALSRIGELVSDLALGVRAASGVTLIASILVLAGALAAGHRHRVYDAVILKTLGATRSKVTGAFALEYLLLGLATALFGVVAGALAAYVVIEEVMRIDLSLDLPAALGAALGALLLTILLGLVGTWRVLGERPAPVLRNL